MSRAPVTEMDEVSCWLLLQHMSSFCHLLLSITGTQAQATNSSALNYCSCLLAVPYFCPCPCARLFSSHKSLRMLPTM